MGSPETVYEGYERVAFRPQRGNSGGPEAVQGFPAALKPYTAQTLRRCSHPTGVAPPGPMQSLLLTAHESYFLLRILNESVHTLESIRDQIHLYCTQLVRFKSNFDLIESGSVK